MAQRRLTSKQAEFLRLMLDLLRETGRPPTIRQLQARGRFSSPRSVTQFLEALEGAGYIERGEGARNIRVLKSPPAGVLDHAHTVQVPVVGAVAAGLPILAIQNIESYVAVSDTIARPPHKYFFLRVEGDSMNRAGIQDGSIALIRQQQAARPGENVVALIDEEATIKRLRLVDGMVILEPVSSNPKHRPIVVDREFRIQGVVVRAMALKV
jgi:repressor LexA